MYLNNLITTIILSFNPCILFFIKLPIGTTKNKVMVNKGTVTTFFRFHTNNLNLKMHVV